MTDRKVKSSIDSMDELHLHASVHILKKHLAFLSIFCAAFLSVYLHNTQLFYKEFFLSWLIFACLVLIAGFKFNYVLSTSNTLSDNIKKCYIYTTAVLSAFVYSLAFLSTNLPFTEMDVASKVITIVGLTVGLVSVHLSAVVFLTHQYRYFLSFIFPALIPIVYFKTEFQPIQQQLLFSIGFYLYTGIILYLGYLASKFHQLSLNDQYNIIQLKRQNQNQEDDLETIKSQLEIEKQGHAKSIQQLKDKDQFWQNEISQQTANFSILNTKLEHSYHNLELAHEAAGIASWDWDVKNRVVNTINFSKLFGYNVNSLNHYIHYLHEYIHPEDIDIVKKEMRDHLRGLTERYEAIYRVHHQTQQWVWVHDVGRVTLRDPKSKIPLRMVGIRRNIQHEKINEEQLILSAKIFKKLNQGVFILDTQLTYVKANPYFLQLIGMTESDLKGKYIFDVSKGNRSDLQKMHLTVLKQLMNTGSFEGEVFEELHNGRFIPLHIDVNPIYDEQNRLTQYIGLVTDLTERKSSEERLSYLENYDTLTDLPNRYYFNKKLHDYLNNDLRFLNKIAVLRINLDRFRYYNELLNQQGGDELLKEVAARLRRASANAAVVARLNSDDFAVIYEIKDSVNEVTEYCKRLIRIFDNTFKIKHQEFIMTLSIGMAFFPDHGRQMDSLNTHAELALLEAKRVGGNAVRIYHNNKHISSEPRLKLESELRKAIQNKELILYFQPKVNSASQDIYGFEALIRWNHPQHGIIPPAQFIPLAEETSLISDIGRFVIEMACAQIKKWSDAGFKNISVSVNVVVQQINRGNLIDEIDYMFKKYGINPTQLELEITETSLMENNENVRKVMEQLQQRNIRVSLDDFGIGYSSLAYLTQYPFEIIKIDRSFIAGIGVANKDAIVRAMIAMAKAMGKKVVAEGIETQAHYNFLVAEGCDYLQGYLIGKPMPADLATELLHHHRTKPHFQNILPQ